MDAKEFDPLLDAYLEGGLSPEQLAVFQDALDGHPALRDEFEAHQEIEGMLGAFQTPPTPASLRDKVMEVVRAEAVSQTAQAKKPGLLDMVRATFAQWQVPAFATACVLGVVAYGVLTHLPSAPTDDALPVLPPRTESVVVAEAESVPEDASAPFVSPTTTPALSFPDTEMADASPIKAPAVASNASPESFEAVVATPRPVLVEERLDDVSLPVVASQVAERDAEGVASTPRPGSRTERVQIASADSRVRETVAPRATPQRPMPTASFRVEASQPPALRREASSPRDTSSAPVPRDALTIAPLPSTPRQASSLSGAQVADAREPRNASSQTQIPRRNSERRTNNVSTMRSAADSSAGRDRPTPRPLSPPAFSARRESDRTVANRDTGMSQRLDTTSRNVSRTAPSRSAAPAYSRPDRDVPVRVASSSAPPLRRPSETNRQTTVAFDPGFSATTVESLTRRQEGTRDLSPREPRYSASEASQPAVVFDVYLRPGRSGLSLRDFERRLQKRRVQTLRLKSSRSEGGNVSSLNGHSRERGTSLGSLLCSVRGRDAAWVAKELGAMDLKSAKAWRSLRKPDESKAKGYYFSAVRGARSAPVPESRSSSSEHFVFEIHFRYIPVD